jgi:hypothetical protein
MRAFHGSQLFEGAAETGIVGLLGAPGKRPGRAALTRAARKKASPISLQVGVP